MIWLSGWSKRKSHIVSGSADAALSDYTPTPITLLRRSLPAWAAGLVVQLGYLIEDSGNVYEVTTAGTTNSSKPTFTTTTTDDNTAVWTFKAAYVSVPTAKADFSDIRVTAGDESTQLDFWLQKSTVPDTEDIRLGCNGQTLIVDADTWYVPYNGTIYKTTDAGITFAAVKAFTDGADNHTVIRNIFRTSKGILFCSPESTYLSAGEAGIWRSADAGANWTRVYTLGVDGSNTWCDTIWSFDETQAPYDATYGGDLFASVYTIGTSVTHKRAEVLKSTDGGANWSVVLDCTTAPYDNAKHMHDIKVDPYHSTNGINHVYTCNEVYEDITKSHILKTVDGGVTWSEILTTAPQMVAIGITPTARLFGTDTPAPMRSFRTADDTNISISMQSVDGYFFWFRYDSANAKIYAGLASHDPAVGTNPYYSGVYVSSDDGVSFQCVKDYPVNYGGRGPRWGSNITEGMLITSSTDGNSNPATTKNGVLYHLDVAKKMYIKMATIPQSGEATVYLYYGNASASSASSGADTFTFFDDFDGASFDAAKWDVVDGETTDTISYGTANSVASFYQGAFAGGLAAIEARAVLAKTGYSKPVEMGYLITDQRSQSADAVADGGLYAAVALVNSLSATKYPNVSLRHLCRRQTSQNNLGMFRCYDGTTVNEVTGAAWTNGVYRIKSLSGGATLTNDHAGAVASNSIAPADTMKPYVGLGKGNTTAVEGKMAVDWIYVRSITANEPTHSTWGAEETPPVAPAHSRPKSGFGFRPSPRFKF